MTKQPVSVNGVVRWKDVGQTENAAPVHETGKVILLRHAIGEVLRNVRQRQGRTLVQQDGESEVTDA